jgi:hypothetical protein
MCKDPARFYRFAIYAALSTLTATLGWVVITLGTSVPTIL